MKKTSILFICCLSLFISVLHAEVKLPSVFSDNMVLQRDMPITVWGWADKGETVEVRLLDKVKRTKADNKGYWRLQLAPLAYGGPYTMEVKGKKNSITLKNILIGEVWLCSGQSNMEWTVGSVKDAKTEISNANYPQIRSFNVVKDMSMQPQSDLKGSWNVCTPETVSDFSAVAYFFARKLNKELNIPIGIINSSWGGTDIETWTSWDSFGKLPDKFVSRYKDITITSFEQFAKENEQLKKAYLQAQKDDKGISEAWFSPSYNTSSWSKMKVPQFWTGDLGAVDGLVWFKYSFSLPENVKGKPASIQLGGVDDEDITWINGVKIGETNGPSINRLYQIPENILNAGTNVITVRVNDTGGQGGLYSDPEELYIQIDGKKYPLAGEWQYKTSVTNVEYKFVNISPNIYPSLLYNAMINPITQFAIKGSIWYQGENNASQAYNYRTLFPIMINDWRNQWGYPFPFYWVQLANFMAKDDVPKESDWAELREAQTMTLSFPYTGQAVISDIGEASDIHPRNKQDVGLRLALIALNKDYNKKDVVYSGPTFKSMSIEDNKAIISFDNIASGLKVTGKYGYIEGFAIAGADKKFEWAKAYLDGDKVVVFSDKISKPFAVRYAWSNNPDVNLYNSEDLPAVPFRTDTWQGITQHD